MKTARIVLLFPLALFRLIMIFLVSLMIGRIGWIWLKLFGFSRKFQNWSMRTWGRACIFLLGIRATHYKIPKNQHFILMPNHRSYLDIFIVARYTPSAFIGKAELKNWPLIKTGAQLTNMIFVSRNEMKSLVDTIRRIKTLVNSGIPVTIFPEGTTSKGPLTKPFKNGSFKIAADSGIPVIPMAIHFNDENDAWIDDDKFVGHFFRQMSKPVTKVDIRYGTPIINPDFKLLQNETRKQIDEMLQEMTGQN